MCRTITYMFLPDFSTSQQQLISTLCERLGILWCVTTTGDHTKPCLVFICNSWQSRRVVFWWGCRVCTHVRTCAHTNTVWIIDVYHQYLWSYQPPTVSWKWNIYSIVSTKNMLNTIPLYLLTPLRTLRFWYMILPLIPWSFARPSVTE